MSPPLLLLPDSAELEAYKASGREERIVQESLRELFEKCWEEGPSRSINAHPLFKTIQQEALYLEYHESVMEDSNSLFMDIMGALSEKLVRLGITTLRISSFLVLSLCLLSPSLTSLLSYARSNAFFLSK